MREEPLLALLEAVTLWADSQPQRRLSPAKRRRADLLDGIYHLPNPCDTFESWERFVHKDLLGFSRAQLLHERERVRLRLTLADNQDLSNGWLLQRLARLEGALAGG